MNLEMLTRVAESKKDNMGEPDLHPIENHPTSDLVEPIDPVNSGVD